MCTACSSSHWGVSTRHPPPEVGTPCDQAPPQDQAPPLEQGPPLGPGTPPLWTEFLTHACENITLPQTSFAGGKNAVKMSWTEPILKHVTLTSPGWSMEYEIHAVC